MENSDYWRRRAEMLEAARNKAAGDCAAEIERQFNLAEKTLNEQIERWYGRFATNNQITLAEARQWLTGKDLTEFNWDVNEYIRHGKNVGLNPAYIKQLENASARFHISRLEALKLKTQNTVEQLYGRTAGQSASFFGELYREQYYHTIFDAQKGFGVGWDIAALNEKQVENVLSKPWTMDGRTFSDRTWKNKTDLLSEIHTHLTQNALLGKPPGDAINAIAKKFNTSKSNAGRLIMTESAYFATEAQNKAFRELGVEEYGILATLDSSTSTICREADGKRFPMTQFEPGVTAPPFHPWCRTVIVPYFDDDEGERAARDETTGKTYYVPSDMKYDEWKAAYVDGFESRGLTRSTAENIMDLGGDTMGVLPRADSAIIPLEKFIKYALNPDAQPHKALAFELALGYNINNVQHLIDDIRASIKKFPAKNKGNKGYGDVYEVILMLTGPNGKAAKVLTGWIDDAANGEMRLTSVYVDK